jgi:hypothetical protein
MVSHSMTRSFDVVCFLSFYMSRLPLSEMWPVLASRYSRPSHQYYHDRSSWKYSSQESD